MKKREFLKAGGVLALGTLIVPNASCNAGTEKSEKESDKSSLATGPFTLPDLPYAHDALEPYIDTQTMQIHHGKHHAGYVRKLNAALDNHEWAGQELSTILAAVTADAIHTGLRNNGGGHYNHSLFWKVMKPGGGDSPSGKLSDAITSTFTSYDEFKAQFAKAAATRFGSGWAWLSVDENGKLFISSTPNQDNPMMKNLAEQTGTPLLGIDVWEHAYYLKYQNKRTEYIDNFMSIINWEEVASNYDAIG